MAGPPPTTPFPLDPNGTVQRAIDPLLRPLAAFFRHKVAGAGLLLAAAVLALLWAASPWGNVYRDLLQRRRA